MRIKVCGIRNKRNLSFLADESVDFVGFIFYSKSNRSFEEGDLSASDLMHCTKQKVGVFVNESIDTIIETANIYSLNYIQLHGDESPEYCKLLNKKGHRLIKAFSVLDQLPGHLKDYAPYVEYFLFDTKGQFYGGNGIQFDWSILDEYTLSNPFILSGGIGLEDAADLRKIMHPKLMAVDVNSRFEISPGYKDEQKIKEFIKELKKQKIDEN